MLDAPDHECFMLAPDTTLGGGQQASLLEAHRPITIPDEGFEIEHGFCPLCLHDAFTMADALVCLECHHAFLWQGEYAYAVIGL